MCLVDTEMKKRLALPSRMRSRTCSRVNELTIVAARVERMERVASVASVLRQIISSSRWDYSVPVANDQPDRQLAAPPIIFA